ARQAEILRLLAVGKDNAAIAAQLVLSKRTVEHHVAALYERLGVAGRVEAAAFAHRHGLVE
ncbi:MAG: LuxR C-terminal-related transcriptional regulator, partial [Actinomycetota bacterium]|nr:LuxR C-terminal-related transcriptional regulator [Actinomycetota bacterium]